MSHQGDAAGDSVEIGGVTLGTDTRQLDPGATEPSAVDLARYTAARVAADDPELVLGPLTVIAHEVGLPFRPARRSAGLAA